MMDDDAIFEELAGTPGALEILRLLKGQSDAPKTLSPLNIGLGHERADIHDFLEAAHLLMDRGLMMAEAVQMAEGREPWVVDALITQRGARLVSPDMAESRWMRAA